MKICVAILIFLQFTSNAFGIGIDLSLLTDTVEKAKHAIKANIETVSDITKKIVKRHNPSDDIIVDVQNSKNRHPGNMGMIPNPRRILPVQYNDMAYTQEPKLIEVNPKRYAKIYPKGTIRVQPPPATKLSRDEIKKVLKKPVSRILGLRGGGDVSINLGIGDKTALAKAADAHANAFDDYRQPYQPYQQYQVPPPQYFSQYQQYPQQYQQYPQQYEQYFPQYQQYPPQYQQNPSQVQQQFQPYNPPVVQQLQVDEPPGGPNQMPIAHQHRLPYYQMMPPQPGQEASSPGFFSSLMSTIASYLPGK